MTALNISFVSINNPQSKLVHGSLRSVDQCLFSTSAKPSSCRKSLAIRAGRDGGREGSAGLFVGGFILGGLVAGTLGCVYAPEISKALAGVDRKDLMKKLPKFIYDEEKALKKNRQILEDKIAQLNFAIDDVSAKLHATDSRS